MNTAYKALMVVAMVVAMASCQEEAIEKTAPASQEAQSAQEGQKNGGENGKYAKSHFYADDWLGGTLPNWGSYDGRIVSPANMQFTSGRLEGPELIVSNNPEQFTSDGWLMQTSNKGRGSSTYTISDKKAALYLFHYNTSGSGKYIHVLATNPSWNSMYVTARGTAFNSQTKPLPPGVPGTGPSYAVADSWLRGNLASRSSGEVRQYGAFEAARIYVPNGKFVDGRYEIEVSGSALFYVVATNNGSLSTAIDLSQRKAASGKINRPGPGAFGRSGGVYEASQFNGSYSVDLPSATGHIGFCFNTTNKFNFNLQEQNPRALMNLSDSSPRNYGNYGLSFYQNFNIRNFSLRTRTVRFYLASINHAANSGVRANQLTYNATVKLNGAIKRVAMRGDDPKVLLAEWSVSPYSSFNATLEGYFPGLLTVGQQVILETAN